MRPSVAENMVVMIKEGKMFIYLASTLTTDQKNKIEVKRRIRIAEEALKKKKPLFYSIWRGMYLEMGSRFVIQ